MYRKYYVHVQERSLRLKGRVVSVIKGEMLRSCSRISTVVQYSTANVERRKSSVIVCEVAYEMRQR